MKYCTSYYQSSLIRTKVDEVRFSIGSFNSALDYADDHLDKRIIIEVLELHEEHVPSISKLHQLHQEHTNISYDFYNLYDLIEYSRAYERQANYIMYHQPALTWGLVQILLYYNVSDIVIGEPLTFNVTELEKNIHSKNVKLRIRPHLAKTKIARGIETDCGIHHFWVLPQHVKFYEQYIDVLDLLDDNVARETALVNAYTCGEDYEGRLDTLVEGVETEVGAAFIDDKFVQRRLTCGQNCLKNSNYCHFCDQYIKMYDVIAANHKDAN